MKYQIAMILNAVLNLYTMLIFAWAILSWFNKGRGIVNDIYKVLNSVVAPYVNLFRRFVPPLGGMDFSPIIALVVLQIVSQFVFRILLW